MGDRFGCEPFTIPVVCRPTMPYCLGAQPANLVNLLKAISLEGKPVMVSGPVSCGKTSSIEYVAKLLGVRTILVVLDEHTDL
jgi:midasin (ATPase involved in ribosome maturation)